MAETGIVEVLSEAFGGILKMLIGKKFPDNVRALRMLTEEILRVGQTMYSDNGRS
jgi:hypothetical protein